MPGLLSSGKIGHEGILVTEEICRGLPKGVCKGSVVADSRVSDMLTDNRSSVSDARVLDVAMLAVQARCYIDLQAVRVPT